MNRKTDRYRSWPAKAVFLVPDIRISNSFHGSSKAREIRKTEKLLKPE